MINKNSNKFTMIFATIMVVVVAVLLATAAIQLGPYQQKNIRIEKMQNILSSVGVQSEPAEAESVFSKYIHEQVVLNHEGKIIENSTITAFDIDLKKEQDKLKTGRADEQLFPLFILKKNDSLYYVIPVRGKGLWGPIWGYLALKGDMNSVYGASFDHKSETPGLGAEINTAEFQDQFTGKTIFDESGNFVSVKVLKGGASPNDMHGVDAISGGTVTSNGVTEMLSRTLKNYIPYFESRNLAKIDVPVSLGNTDSAKNNKP